MFFLKHREIEIKFYVIIIQEAFFSKHQALSLCPDTWQCLCLHTLHQEAPPPALEKFLYNSATIQFFNSHNPGL